MKDKFVNSVSAYYDRDEATEMVSMFCDGDDLDRVNVADFMQRFAKQLPKAKTMLA